MVHERLTIEGYEVTAAFNGEEALKKLNEQTFDVIILDLMLPKMDGMECLKIIRSKSMVPVLIMSAKGEDVDKAIGLGFGADDYISKPFSMIELIARVKAIIRRETHHSNSKESELEDETKTNIFSIGDLTVDIKIFSVKKHDKEINLTANVFNILYIIITDVYRVFTNSQLLFAVWHDEYYVNENFINVHIRRLREKIEDDPCQTMYI